MYLFHDSFRDVEDPLAVEPEAIIAITTLIAIIARNEALYVVPDVLGKLFEEYLRLFLCQRSHFSAQPNRHNRKS